MRAIRQSLFLSVVVCLSACSRVDPAELFKLRAACANQARQFETDWRRDNGSDFEFLLFQNHYNQTRGRCFVHIYYGNADLNLETVYDALEGVSKSPVVLVVGGNDKAANESKEHRDLVARVRDYMEEENKPK